MFAGHNNLLFKAVLPLDHTLGLTALALFSAGKIHSADRPATANYILSITTEKSHSCVKHYQN